MAKIGIFERSSDATVNDSAVFPRGQALGIFVGTGGTITAANNEVPVVLVGARSGSIIPIRLTRIYATGTTATDIKVLYGGEMIGTYGLAETVTPSDTVEQPGGTWDALYVGGAGNIRIVSGGAAVTLSNVAAGTVIPIRGIRVATTSTTATSILALYGAP